MDHSCQFISIRDLTDPSLNQVLPFSCLLCELVCHLFDTVTPVRNGIKSTVVDTQRHYLRPQASHRNRDDSKQDTPKKGSFSRGI